MLWYFNVSDSDRMIIERPRILIVDDTPGNVALIEAMLRGIHASLFRAGSGEEAVAMTAGKEFALVLMDISLPGIDGFTAVRQIRRQKQNKLLNVIYLTAEHDELVLRIKGMQTGAVDFITKPVHRELFVGKVTIFLNLYLQRKCLEEEIAKRAVTEKELIRAREQAEASAQARQQFLSTLSHEIRTPLNAILNMVHFLSGSAPTAEQSEYIDTLRFSAEGMMRLVNQVLEYSKVDSGTVEFCREEFAIRDLVRGIAMSMQPVATRKGLRLESGVSDGVPEVIIGDCSRLTEILMNLISNAIKFTETGQVSLRVEVSDNLADSTELMFHVTDTGIGIPEDQQDRIFDSFTQVNPTRHAQHNGTGLGLPITRMLVERQGGRLSVESKPGLGSTFSFTLPFGKSLKQQVEIPRVRPDLPHQMKGLSVLVAEDNIVNRNIVKKILHQWEVNADFAENGKEALQKVRKNHYNLVLMDLHMPEMNGYDATRAIRNLGGDYYRNLPIVALTATAFAEDQKKFSSIGLNGYIIKPFTPPELYTKMSCFLKNNQT